MALSTEHLTLYDVARRSDPDGKAAVIAEVLAQSNEILDDIPWVEGNLPTGHKTTLRGSLPTPTWRLLNQGVAPTKSGTKQITEVCGMMEAYSQIDVSLANMARDVAAFRLSEDKAFIEGMAQTLAYTLFYGNEDGTEPEKFLGFTGRYYSLATTVTTYGQIIDAGGAGADNTSIWLVAWGENSVHGIYPRGSKAGLSQQDLGEQTVLDSSNNPYQAYRTHFKWDCGLCVRDYRSVVRIANIDNSDILTAGDAADSSANLLKYMSVAIDKIKPVGGSSRLVFYANDTVLSMLRVKLMNKSNVQITLEQMQGAGGIQRPTLHFMGVPVRLVDQLGIAEAEITT